MHNRRWSARLLGSVIAISVASSAQAGFLYDESFEGDLSNDPTAPTALTLALGDNVINASTGSPFDADGDMFSVEIGPGMKLVAIEVLFYLAPKLPDNESFIGFDAGPAFDPADLMPPYDGLLGFTMFSANDIGSDILPSMGFRSLQEGIYSFAVIDPSSQMTYTLNFVTIPAPAAWLLITAIAIAGSRRRYRDMHTAR